jgi:type II secretory pathway component PulJ
MSAAYRSEAIIDKHTRQIQELKNEVMLLDKKIVTLSTTEVNKSNNEGSFIEFEFDLSSLFNSIKNIFRNKVFVVILSLFVYLFVAGASINFFEKHKHNGNISHKTSHISLGIIWPLSLPVLTGYLLFKE